MKKQGQLYQNGKRSFPVGQFLCILLMLCVVFILLPGIALAAEDGYSYDADTKVLTITTNAEATYNASWRSAPNIKSNVTTIIVANTVNEIGSSGFGDCPQLTSIVIGEGVTSIGNKAFNNCPKLTTFTVAGGNGSYQAVDNVLLTEDGKTLVKYPEGKTGTSYTVPDGVEIIGSYAFAYNSHITSIQLPNSLQRILDYAFYSSTKLSSMDIPPGVTEIGIGALMETALTSVTIPAKVTKIPTNAFFGCSQLTSVTIGKGVVNVDSNAFSNCPKLNTFIVDEENNNLKAVSNVLITKDGKTLVKYPNGLTAKSYTIPEGVEIIGNRAFFPNAHLEEITLPDSVTKIGAAAFWNCKELRSVHLGEGLQTIEESAFSECEKLSSINFPAGLTSIGPTAFWHCFKLSSVDLPAGLKSIGGSAFSVTKIVSITIPATVTSIGNSVFSDCNDLKTVIMNSNPAPTLGTKVFPANAMIYTPVGAAGYDAENWPSGKVVEGRAHLSALSLSGITLSPSFSGATTSYTASVAHSVSSTTVTPTMAIGTAIKVNGAAVASGSASAAIPLSDGDNNITVVVENSSYPEETRTYTIVVTKATLTPNPKPNAAFMATGADSGILTNVTTDMVYSVNGGSTWNPITEPSMNIIGVTPLNGIQIKAPGDDTTTADSEVQVIAVTQAAPPTGIGKIDETSALHNGAITGVSSLMEYKESSATNYSMITGSTVTGLDGGTYLVRFAATGTTLASPDVSVTITAFTKATPTTADFNYSLDAVTYNGSAQPLSITKKTAGIGDFIVRYNGSASAPTMAGAYTVTVEIIGNAEYNAATLNLGTYIISKAAEPAVANNTVSLILNDTTAKTHMLVGLPTDMGETSYTKSIVTDADAVLHSSSVASSSGEITYQLAAGLTSAHANKTATISVTVVSENYETFTVNFVIIVLNKTDVSDSISFANGSTVYNGSVQTYEAASTTDTSGGSFTYTYSTGDGVLESGKPKGAGTYTVTASYESDTALGSKTASFTINKKAASIDMILSATDITVGDALPTPSLSYSGLVSGENLTTLETPTFSGMPINSDTAGTYSINWDNATAIKAAIEALPAAANYSITYTESVNFVIHEKLPSSGSSGGGSSAPAPAPEAKIESGASLTAANVEKLAAEKKPLVVEGKTGEKLVFDPEALKAIASQAAESVKVEVKDVSAEYKEEHPDRLVFSLTITAGGKRISDFGNGTVTVSLPYELKEGEKAEDVTVWYLAENGTMTEIPCTYDPVTKLATFKVNHFSLYVVGTAKTASWKNTFTDVKENSWYYDAVRYVSEKGLMQGTTETAFSPNAKTTRGMIVTILWRMENEPKASKGITFADVKSGKYYSDAVAWASEKGIVGGYSADRFGPEDNITREQMSVILHNYAVSKGYKIGKTADLSVFSDADQVHNWSKDAISWANAEGLINGTGSNLLNPLGVAERCQVAAILQRFIENTAK